MTEQEKKYITTSIMKSIENDNIEEVKKMLVEQVIEKIEWKEAFDEVYKECDDFHNMLRKGNCII